MGLTNGVTADSTEEKVQELQQALVSSSTKWRLTELSRWKETIRQGCEHATTPFELSTSGLKMPDSIAVNLER